MNDFISKPINRDKIREKIIFNCDLDTQMPDMDQFRIMLADDELLSLKKTELFVKNQFPNLKIKATATGIEACTLIGSYMPHIIVLNPMMEDISGTEIVRHVKSKDKYERINIILRLISVITKSRISERPKPSAIGWPRERRVNQSPWRKYLAAPGGLLRDVILQYIRHEQRSVCNQVTFSLNQM